MSAPHHTWGHSRSRRIVTAGCVAVLIGVAALWAQVARPAAPPVALPNRADSLRFAVIGDNGTGKREQYEMADTMATVHGRFPYELVIMLGDNLYGSQEPRDFVNKFEKPYAPLLSAGVRFYASLGNHDRPSNRSYPQFNMGGERYYTFARQNIRFFVLDTNAMDDKQLAWLEGALASSHDPWKIAYFHHPLYSDGNRHGSDVELRVILEPLLVRHGVNVVFAGHDHLYERIKPQKGITYFVSGAGGQLRKGGLEPTDIMAAGFDQDRSFMVAEVAGDEMFFQAISRTGTIVDSGVIRRQP